MGFFKLQSFAVIMVALAFSNQANAQWVQTKDVDSFTDQTTIHTKNIGRIIDGIQGRTSLVHRTKDGVTELYWNTPDGFLCDVTVLGRVDQGEPFTIRASLSTDRQSVFFQNRTELMEAMIGSQATRLKLTDSCGSFIVAEFTGNADRLLPEYKADKVSRESKEAIERIKLQEVAQLSDAKKTAGAARLSTLGWKVLSSSAGKTNGWQADAKNNDFIQYENGNTSFTYRKSLTSVGPPYALRFAKVTTYHDLSFAVFDKDLITRADSMRQQLKLTRDFQKAQIRVGKKRFDAKTTQQYTRGGLGEFPNETSGAVAVYLVEPKKVEELYAELLKPEHQNVEVRLKGNKYLVPITNFTEAVRFFED